MSSSSSSPLSSRQDPHDGRRVPREVSRLEERNLCFCHPGRLQTAQVAKIQKQQSRCLLQLLWDLQWKGDILASKYYYLHTILYQRFKRASLHLVDSDKTLVRCLTCCLGSQNCECWRTASNKSSSLDSLRLRSATSSFSATSSHFTIKLRLGSTSSLRRCSSQNFHL